MCSVEIAHGLVNVWRHLLLPGLGVAVLLESGR